MKDLTGMEIHVGDTVVASLDGTDSRIRLCTVIGFTAQKVRVQSRWRGNERGELKDPGNLIIMRAM